MTTITHDSATSDPSPQSNGLSTGTPTVRASLSDVPSPDGRCHVGVITLNRPEKRNALREQECRGVAWAVKSLLAKNVRAILITGEGPVLSAGADLSGGVYGADFGATSMEMLRAITQAPVPVIADVFGPAIGAGCQMILACDLRIFGDEGECWIPSARHGFALDEWTHRRAVELMGGAWARNLFIGGDHLGAAEARTIGFSMDARGRTAEEFAAKVAGQAPISMNHSKLMLNRESERIADAPAGYDEGSCKIGELFKLAWASEDAAEARAALQEKRAPKFEGR